MRTFNILKTLMLALLMGVIALLFQEDFPLLALATLGVCVFALIFFFEVGAEYYRRKDKKSRSRYFSDWD